MPEPPQDDFLLDQWRGGDQAAARQLFERYVDRLMTLVRVRLSQRMAQRVDPEDIVQSVFRTFFGRARDGQFHVEGPEDLCKLLTRIAIHKTFRQVAFHRAAKRNMEQEAAPAASDQNHLADLLSREPTPEEANAFVDQLEHFLGEMRPEDAKIIELRLQGYTDVEIAAKLGISDRKIRRLMERVRGQAEQEGLGP